MSVTAKEMVQFSIRIPTETLARLDHQLMRLSRKSPGVALTRADVLRLCLLEGIAWQEDLEREEGHNLNAAAQEQR